MALSWSDNGKRENKTRFSNWRKNSKPEGYYHTHMREYKAIKLIPERYRFHMAWCRENRNDGNIYDINDTEVLRYELK